MSRRSRSDDLGFGSDSFLDVVTNMVGILIILIVVAGVKVSQDPLDLTQIKERLAAEAALNESSVARVEPVAPAPAPIPLEPPKPVIIEPSQELKRFARAVETELSQLDANRDETAKAVKRSAEQEQELEERRRKVAALLSSEKAELNDAREQFGRVRGTLDETRSMLADLKESIDQASKEKAPVKQIRHQLNPVSMLIDGKEIHFRLSGNKVAHVPIEELVERVRPQIEQKRNQLIKNKMFKGTAGPVGGFVMQFIVQAQSATVVEDLRSGSNGRMKIGLGEWQIVPERDLEAETAEQALRADSKFLRVIRATEPDTTLTLWVYPDSFELYRKLTEFAHDEGFTVAARPLPPGMPISGSPRGSKSAGQ